MLVVLAVLRRRINLHESSIYRLHPELLSLLASHLVTDDLVKATHVSYHWRTVLLSHPSLWSNLDFAYPERASTFFARSKSAMIHVFLPKTPKVPLPIELLKRSAERIATLLVGDYTSQRDLLLQTMSSLRTLQFYAEYKDVFPDEPVRLYFPALETLFAGAINPTPFSVPHLTRFSFNDLACGKQEMDALFDFFRNCPLLEELDVYRVGNFYPHHDRDVVPLPRLRVYNEYSNTDFYFDLYNMLCLPPSCSAIFCCNCDPFCEISLALRPFQTPTPLIPIRRLKLKTTDEGRKDYVEGTVEIIDTAGKRVCLTRQLLPREAVWEDVVTDGFNPLHSGFLEDLDARFIEVLCVEELALWYYRECGRVEEALSHLKYIKTLILADSGVGLFIGALVPSAVADVDEWRCSMLDTIVIRNRSDNPHRGDVLSGLLYVARKRKAAGFPLRSVSVFICSAKDPKRFGWTDSVVEELRGYIETFELVVGDDALDWNVDDYFLDGLYDARSDLSITTGTTGS